MPSPFQPNQYTVIPNPNPPQKSKSSTVLLVSLIIIACLTVMGIGLVSCAAVSFHISEANSEQSSNSNSSSSSESEYTSAQGNATLRNILGETNSIENFTESELKSLKKKYFSGAKASGGNTPQGIYFVGDDSDLKAGTYWMGGSDTELSYFFVLSKSGNTYSCKLTNNYYGHNLIEVKDSEVLVVVNDTAGFCEISKMNEKFSDPYTNGVFRVGTDIPAGTYHLKAGKDSSTYFAYYVMSNLSYEGDYITDQQRSTDSSTFAGYTVTLHDGEYLELYNATATKGSKA